MSPPILEPGNEELYQTILNAISDAVYITDRDGAFTFICQNSDVIFGYGPEEILAFGKIQKLIPDLDKKILNTTKEIENLQLQVKDNKGRNKTAFANIKPVSIGKGRLLFTLRDVTALKRAEEEAEKSQILFRSLADLAPAGIYLTDTLGHCTYANPRWLEMAGLSLEEALGDGWRNGLHPDDREVIFSSWSQAAAENQDWDLEYRFLSKNGKTTWVRGLAAPMLDLHGEVAGFIGINMDITAEKLASHELIRREVTQRALIDAVDDSLFLMQPDGTILLANQTVATRFQQSADELMGFNAFDLVDDQVAARRRAFLKQTLETGKSVRFEDQLGERVIENRFYPIRDEADEINMVAIFGRDITERKQVLAALRESEERFRQISENVREVFYIYDPEIDSFLYVSPTYETLWQQPVQEIYDDPLAFTYQVHPEDLEAFQEAVRKEHAEGRYFNLEYRICRSDGSIRWVWSRNFPVRDNEGKPYRTVGIAEDITERKLAEFALQESERYLTLAQEVAHIGSWKYGLSEKTLYWSQELFRIYGLDPGEGKPSLKLALGMIHPKDADSARKAFNRAVESGIPYEIQYRIIRPDREERVILGIGKIETNPQGKVTSVYGTGQDITERVHTEATLQASEAKYRSIFQLSPDGIATFDKQGKLLSVNQAFLRLTGYEESEFLNHSIFDLPTQPKPHLGSLPELMARAIAGKELGPVRFKWRHKKGEWREGEAHVSHMRVGGETILQTVVHDITERVRSEQERKRLLDQVIQDSNELEKRVQERTEQYQTIIDLTVDREVRMAELKRVIKKLRSQLIAAGLEPVADDPLNEPLDLS